MKKAGYFFKSVFLFAWLFGIVYAMFYNNELSLQYNVSLLIIPTIAVISIIFIVYRFVGLQMKTDKVEGEFTTIVNHIFRTPLTRILWISNELKETNSYDEKIMYIKDVENAAERLLGIVDTIFGIKDLRSRSSYDFKAVSIREIVETSLARHSALVNQKGIKQSVSIFDQMPLLTADLKKISFVMDVLIENAIFYTPQGGDMLIDCRSDSKKITFFVSDNGMGLTAFEKMGIFTKFYRSKRAIDVNPDGMGMGLYLAQIIIKRHGGRLYAKSEGTNKGTTFFVELPINR